MNSLTKSLISSFLNEEEQQKTVGVFGGGFQPPTKGHFQVAKQALEMYPNLDEFIIYVGTGGGRSNITQQQSVAIWNIYKKYLSDKVTIVPSPNPISSIYAYAKENPEANVQWFLGARPENVGDILDIEKRIKAISKKPNLKPVVIKTGLDISGTATRTALDDKETLFQYLPDIEETDKNTVYQILNPGIVDEGEEILNWLEEDTTIEEITPTSGFSKEEYFKPLEDKSVDMKISTTSDRVNYYKDHIKNVTPSDFKVEKEGDKIVVSNINKNGLEYNPEFKEKLISLTLYMIENGLNIEPLPDIIFIEDDVKNANNLLGRTAHYNPNDKSITLFTLKRHPKDILRSFAHEMIHHMQNLEDRITGIQTQDINEDEYLRELEEEAYSKGNMCFRGWENSIKPSINEWIIDIPKYNHPKTLTENLWHTLNEIVLSKDNAVEINGSLTDGQFTVGDQIYVYKIKEFPTPPYYDPGLFYNIEFHPEGNLSSEPQGGKENYIKILSTMYKIILDFVEQEKPKYIGIASLDNEGSKNYHKVYANLTDNKFNRIPGYFRKDASLRFDGPRGKGKMVVLKRKND